MATPGKPRMTPGVLEGIEEAIAGFVYERTLAHDGEPLHKVAPNVAKAKAWAEKRRAWQRTEEEQR